MKTLMQSYRDGTLSVIDAPAPAPRRGRVLVRTAASLVSAGTERYLLDLARKSLVGKAMARPDLVAQVVRKARTDGVKEAWQQATQRLDVPIALGYSSAGVVMDSGDGTTRLSVGDRVACAGAAHASHAEIVSVPSRLCVPVPEGVDMESAAFAAVAGVALEAVRMARVELGSRVLVVGLGLIGQIAVQFLTAAGCTVLGSDLSAARAELARKRGAHATFTGDNPAVVQQVHAATSGQGVDATIILAATKSNGPLELAGEATRERGTVVAAGLVGLELPRKPFYDKELSLVVSRAWGPGLYDPDYAERGTDYPFAFARWTAERNLAEFLTQVARGAVTVQDLITHRFTLDEAPRAYDLITSGSEPSIGVLLTYPERSGQDGRTLQLTPHAGPDSPPRAPAPADELVRACTPPPAGAPVAIGLIGAGLFARTTLLPVFRTRKDLCLGGIATAGGLSAAHTGERHGFRYATTDAGEVFRDPALHGVIITTRHDLHARQAAEALRGGKAVWVEKPLATSEEDLQALLASVGEREPRLLVGFNRRFSPMAVELRRRFAPVLEPLVVSCRVNAGPVPRESWVHDRVEGGGRIIGEVCHFVDLIQFLAGSVTERVFARSLNTSAYDADENVVITLDLANGSIGQITYVACGDKTVSRERIEVFGGGAVGIIDNFREVSFTRGGRRWHSRRWNIDRGYAATLDAFVSMARGEPAPVTLAENVATTRATFAVEESMRSGRAVNVSPLQMRASAT